MYVGQKVRLKGESGEWRVDWLGLQLGTHLWEARVHRIESEPATRPRTVLAADLKVIDEESPGPLDTDPGD